MRILPRAARYAHLLALLVALTGIEPVERGPEYASFSLTHSFCVPARCSDSASLASDSPSSCSVLPRVRTPSGARVHRDAAGAGGGTVSTITPRELIRVLSENVTFPPATASKRFVRDMAARPADAPISGRAERFAWRIAYRFRRQLPKDIAEEAVSRKVDHQWENIGGDKFLLKCAACGSQAWHKTSREINAPCPGTPPPRTEKTPRKSAAARGAVAGAKSPADAPQDSLFTTEENPL